MTKIPLRTPLLVLPLSALALLLGGACGSSDTTGLTGPGGSTGTSMGSGTGASCGNGKVDPGEECDNSAKGGSGPLQGTTCATLGEGFTGGTLACTSTCMWDTAGCTKSVNCFDGTTTCKDPACAAACSDPCASAALLSAPDPSTQSADTSTHPATLTSKCTSSDGTGPNLVYQVTAATTGVLVVDLQADGDMGVSVRTTCDQASSEVACVDHFVSDADSQHLVVPCTAGQTYFVVVGGYMPTDAGDFMLSVGSHAIVCGDGIVDPGEQCDDGNTMNGDGCSSTCTVESTETEPNNTYQTANAYTSPWYAQISPAGDVDFVSVQVSSAPSGITATLSELDEDACSDGTMEAVLTIYGPDGTTSLASIDAGDTDTCASVTATASTAGTYYVEVAASKESASSTFPYALDVSVSSSMCGNGMVDPGEQCDPPEPGYCSATCQFIFSEKEPNNTYQTANMFTGTDSTPWYAQISPAGDVDYVSFAVPAGTTNIDVYVDDNGDGDCETFKIVAQATLYGPGGTTMIASNSGDGSTYCPTILATPMGASFAAGTYYVEVAAGKLEPSATFPYRLRIELEP